MSKVSSEHKKRRKHPEKKAQHDTHYSYASASVAWKGTSGHVSYANEGFNRFPSDNLPQNTFAENTQFDTRWVGAMVHQLKNVCVQIKVMNSDGANAMTFCDPSVWFPRIEVLSNGANVDYVIYDIMFYVDKMVDVTDEKRGQKYLGNIYNPYVFRNDVTSTPYQWVNYEPSTNFKLASGATFDVYGEYPTIMTDANLFFPVLKVEPRIRWYTGNQIQTIGSAAAATTPTLISVITYMRGWNFDDSTLNELMYKFSKRTSITRNIIYERQTFSFQVTAGSETTDSLLTALTGEYAWLFVILSKASPAQDNLYSSYASKDGTTGVYWKKLADVTLLDGNQNPINFVKMPVNYIQSNQWPDHWHSALPQEKEITFLPFASDCGTFRRSGSDTGSRYMDGNFVLRFTPVSVTNNTITANMPVELIVLAARVSTFAQMPNGQVEFRRLSK